jgi:hypothetical protein
MRFDDLLRASVGKLAVAGLALAATLLVAADPAIRLCESFGPLRFGMALAVLAAFGAAVYGGALAIMFGSQWWRNRNG